MLPLILGGGTTSPLIMSSVTVNSVKNSYTISGVVFPGAIGDGSHDDTIPITYWLTQGGLLWVPPGTYRITATCPFTTSGTQMFGSGCVITSILVDDSHGNVGDAFTITNLRGCSITGLTADAPSPRTAGSFCRISGGSNIRLQTFNIALGGHVIDIDTNNQFNGVIIQDSGVIGDWGSTVGNPMRMGSWRNMNSTGVGILLNTPHGASQFIHKIFMSGITGQSPVGIRIIGTGGATIDRIQTEDMANSILIDPSAAMADTVSLLQFEACQFDSCSADEFLVNLKSGSSTPLFIDINNTWIAASGGGQNGIRVTGIAGVALQHLTMVGGSIVACGAYGVKGENGIGTSQIIIDPSVYYGVGGLANVLGNTNYT